MHPKKICILTKLPDAKRRLKTISEDMDIELTAVDTTIADAFSGIPDETYDMVVADFSAEDLEKISKADSAISEDEEMCLLVIISPEDMSQLRLPVHISSDFVCADATNDEYEARIRHLLWPGEEGSDNEFIRQGSLTLNLATYQVKIDGEPVDFTYLEYALLAFLITHPDRTYPRDALLSRVWDFDYYGGSRTVDVHVRRIRAKLGPDLAQHLKTVRGVGYLWSF